MFASIMTTTRISVLAAAALFALFVSEAVRGKAGKNSPPACA